MNDNLTLEQILKELEKRASDRASFNFISYFNTIEQNQKASSFFPTNTITNMHPPASEWVLIPKYTMNRYAKFWIVKWPVRVSFLVNNITNGIKQLNIDNETLKRLSNTIKNFDIVELQEIFKKILNTLKNTGNTTTLTEKIIEYIKEFLKEYVMGPFDKFYITDIFFNVRERNDITLAVGDIIPYLQFSGSSVIEGSLYGVAPNAINFDGVSSSIYQWFNYIRGTQLVKRYQTLVLDFDDLQFYIYPFKFAFNLEANKGYFSFNIDFVLTRISRVRLDDSQLETPQDWIRSEDGLMPHRWLSREYNARNIEEAFSTPTIK
ncbi:MAG: hypothetical protein ACO2O4_05085 [Minisyncoccia bacterium]|jgi:hypothetical protein